MFAWGCKQFKHAGASTPIALGRQVSCCLRCVAQDFDFYTILYGLGCEFLDFGCDGIAEIIFAAVFADVGWDFLNYYRRMLPVQDYGSETVFGLTLPANYTFH